MAKGNAGTNDKALDPEDAEVLASVPLLERYFRRSNVNMPAQLERTFEKHGLTARHGAVLAQLAAHTELSVSSLATTLRISLPTASELVSELQAAGVVVRREDPKDRRRTLVTIAARCVDDVTELVRARAKPLLAVLKQLSTAERKAFAKGLRAWAKELSSWQ